MKTYTTYAVYYDQSKVRDAFFKARESGNRAGVDWEDVKVRNIVLDGDDDYVATFEPPERCFLSNSILSKSPIKDFSKRHP